MCRVNIGVRKQATNVPALTPHRPSALCSSRASIATRPSGKPKWGRSLRKRLWRVLDLHDKRNSYTCSRPVNMERNRPTIPPLTFEDHDHGKISPRNLLLLLPTRTAPRGRCRVPRPKSSTQCTVTSSTTSSPTPSTCGPTGVQGPPRSGSRTQCGNSTSSWHMCRYDKEED